MELQFTPKLVDWAVDNSYDPSMGGRPARKFIEKILIKPLADQMIDDTINAETNKEITLDLNKKSNVCFKNKRGKILGELENTQELVQKIEESKFSKKPKI